MNYKIERLSNLDSSYLGQVTKIFGDCFGHMFTKDIDKLAKCFEKSFVKEMVYVYIEDNVVLGFVSASSINGRAMKINKKPFIEAFGKAKGNIFCWQIDKIMTKVIVKSGKECYIDFLAVDKDARGRGIAKILLNYIHKDTRYEKYILEVLSKNTNAKKVYEKVGYKVIKHEKNIFMTLSGQGSAFIMEYSTTLNKFWENFVLKTNRDKDTRYIECFHFELTENLANELLRLVLIGEKQATSSSLLAYQIEGDRIPQVGDLSIVTDWQGTPKCVIETTNVMVTPFKDITFDICKREGEDDNLESWRKGHISFFSSEGAKLGYTFTEDMPVIFEDFKMVYSQ